MQRQVWKRLDRIEGLLSQRNTQNVVVIQDVDESDEELEDRIVRWKSGAVVRGIRDVYRGADLYIFRVQLVSPKRPKQSDD